MTKPRLEMLPIQTQDEIFADLLVIQQANAGKPPPKVVVNMRKHKKAQARSGLVNYSHKKPEAGVGRPRNKNAAKTKDKRY